MTEHKHVLQRKIGKTTISQNDVDVIVEKLSG